MQRPPLDELPSYYHGYVRLVPEGDVLELLAEDAESGFERWRDLDDAQVHHRYAPGKWSLAEVVGHVCDTERVFAFRALHFARGDGQPLPGFEQDDWVAAARFDERPWAALLDELRAARLAHVGLFRSFDAAAWPRAGMANGRRLTVRSIPLIVLGHALHHQRIVEERYLSR